MEGCYNFQALFPKSILPDVPRRPLSPVDAAWYRMDRPHNPAVITGLLSLDAPVDRETVRDVFADRLLDFERFRHRVVEMGVPWALPHWVPDEDFDLDAHIQALDLSSPGTRSQLLDRVSTLASAPLPPDRPLWTAYVIDRGATSALVIRYHHCMADGTGSIVLARQLLDPTEDPSTDQPSRHPSSLPNATSLLDRAGRGLRHGLRAGANWRRHPCSTLRHVPTLAEALSVATHSVLSLPDPPSPLRAPLSGTQQLAHTEPFPLAAVKAVGRPVHATVNDVLTAAVAGALRRYLLAQDTEPPLPSLRAIVPVDLRDEEHALELGNAFGLTFLPLPVDAESPRDRLHAAKRGMDAIKDSPEAPVFLGILGLFGQLPARAQNAAATLFASKASAVLTNVTGPAYPHTFAGRTVEQVVFWVPYPVSLGLGLSLLSYAGALTVGVMADVNVIEDPSFLVRAIEDEMEALRSAMGVAPEATPP